MNLCTSNIKAIKASSRYANSSKRHSSHENTTLQFCENQKWKFILCSVEGKYG